MSWGTSTTRHEDEYYDCASGDESDFSDYSSEHSRSDMSGSSSGSGSSEDSDASEVSLNAPINIEINVDRDESPARAGYGKSHRKGRTHTKKKRKPGNGHRNGHRDGHRDDDVYSEYEMPIYNATRDMARDTTAKTGRVVRDAVDFLDSGARHLVDDAERVLTGSVSVLTGQAKAKPPGKAPAKIDGGQKQVRTPVAPSSALGVKRGQPVHYDMGHTLDVHHTFNLSVSPGAAKNSVPSTSIHTKQIGHAIATRVRLSHTTDAKPFGLVPEKSSDRMVLAQIACGRIKAHLVDPQTGLKVGELPYDIGVRYSTTPGQGKSSDSTALEEHFNQQMHPNAPGMGLVGHSGDSIDAVHVNSLAPLLSHPLMYTDHYHAKTEFDNAITNKQLFTKGGEMSQYGSLRKSSGFYKLIAGGGSLKEKRGGKSIFKNWVAKEKKEGTFHEDEEFIHHFPVSIGERLCKEIQDNYDRKSIKHGINGGVHFEFHPISRKGAKEECSWDTGISSKLLSGGAMIQITGAAKATFAIPQPATQHEAKVSVVGNGM